MPIYEYECRRCAHRFEVLQKFSDKPRKRCPECRSAVDKVISPPAIRFKGTGWYVTDYADKKSGGPDSKGENDSASDKSDSKTSDSGTSSDAKKSDTKKPKKDS